MGKSAANYFMLAGRLLKTGSSEKSVSGLVVTGSSEQPLRRPK
jgi:hypothetical protein